MLQKLQENKWTIAAIILALVITYYFYHQNQTNH